MHVKYPNYTLETVQLFTGNVIYSPAEIRLQYIFVKITS